MRNTTDLRDSRSFDHVGRDTGADGLIAGEVLTRLAKEDDRITLGTADLTYVSRLGGFKTAFPDRFFQYGIAERNMIGAAAGQATCGLIPYVATFACFSAILGYEGIRTDLAYPGVKVRILASHAGISMGFFGTSHHATEDIAALRAISGLTILSPPDAAATERLIGSTVDWPGPIYFRLSRGQEPPLYDSVPDGYDLGAPYEVASGEDVLLAGTGIMVQECLRAARELEERLGVSISVLDVHTLKPFDDATFAEIARRHSLVVTVEEHNTEGGLGTIVADALMAHQVGVPLYKHGLYDEFAIIGPPTHLYAYYGLTHKGISTVVERAWEARSAPFPKLWTDADKREHLSLHQSR